MAVETVRIGYTRLFEVRLLHHYWLDDGATVFEAITDEAVRTNRLLRYDVRRLLRVEPGATTVAAIKGLRGVFRMTGLGFLVAVPDDTVVLLDSTPFVSPTTVSLGVAGVVVSFGGGFHLL